MTLLINLGRLAMLAWALYALLLVFAPALIHEAPQVIAGSVQFVLAYGTGWALDRLLGRLRRRRALDEQTAGPGPGGTGTV